MTATPDDSSLPTPTPTPTPTAADGRVDFAGEWEIVERDWADPKAHSRFLMLCSTSHRLDEAGKRYRAVRDADPARREEATRQIDALLSLAMQSLATLKTTPTPKHPAITFVAFGVAIVIVGSAIWSMLRNQ